MVCRLLSNRAATTQHEACELSGCYRARWEIERFFLVLKAVCWVELLLSETRWQGMRDIAVFVHGMRYARALPPSNTPVLKMCRERARHQHDVGGCHASLACGVLPVVYC